ncbi:33177_t:CDS:2 [Gigaspora margarita]|uniref:33177_t:CDS:1 n=1 Tax=Gigaspora margarita TaxID=4874 RepID=A0ABN7UIF7_GIGMA|nr:33177_t:CDS:2 [Gigaspora margarita]
MGRTRKRAVPVHKGAQHTLSSIDLAEEQTPCNPSTSSISSRLVTTITSIHDMQLQMFATIQEMQTKINELHANLKIGSGNNMEKETKWIEI